MEEELRIGEVSVAVMLDGTINIVARLGDTMMIQNKRQTWEEAFDWFHSHTDYCLKRIYVHTITELIRISELAQMTAVNDRPGNRRKF